MHGEIVGLDEKTVLLEVADKIKIKVERASIAVVNKQGEVEGVTQ
jgi:preprotein translocase subunit YajC